MSTSVSSDHTSAVTDDPGSGTTELRKLYFVRFGFAILWAALFAATASTINPASATLLLVYPLFDVFAAVVDLRASGDRHRGAALGLNMVLSAVAAVGLAIAVASGSPAVLRIWGAWAVTAGLVQLVVAIGRRRIGGQVAMMLSGGISVLAGAGFFARAGTHDPSLTNLAGYATLGGIFFLVSAIRLHRRGRQVR